MISCDAVYKKTRRKKKILHAYVKVNIIFFYKNKRNTSISEESNLKYISYDKNNKNII